jgi:hypothetical protein
MTDLPHCNCSCGCVIPLTTTDADKPGLSVRYKGCFLCDVAHIHEGTEERKAIVSAQAKVTSWRKVP